MVLDPFLGSGATAEAAVPLERCCIGIERDDRYYTRARARVVRALAAQPLPFADAEVSA